MVVGHLNDVKRIHGSEQMHPLLDQRMTGSTESESSSDPSRVIRVTALWSQCGVSGFEIQLRRCNVQMRMAS